MTWLCDYERCYRVARLFRMTDGRDRPRCALHQGPRVPTEEYRRAESEALLAREKPFMRWGKSLVVDVISEAWARRLVQNYASLEERAFAEAAKESEKLGVLPQIPQAKDGEALFTTRKEPVFPPTRPPLTDRRVTGWATSPPQPGVAYTFPADGDCVVGVSGVARVTVGPEGVVYHGGPAPRPTPELCTACFVKAHTCILVVAGSHHRVCGECHAKLTAKPAPSFRVGQWVRFKTGQLARIIAVHPNGTCHIESTVGRSGMTANEMSVFEPAIPRVWEWWEWKTCATHGMIKDDPAKLTHSLTGAVVEAAVICGCIAPVNFGRGNANPEVKA